jgi:hypothetical protein
MGHVFVFAVLALFVAALSANAQRWTLEESVRTQIDEVFDFVNEYVSTRRLNRLLPLWCGLRSG